MNTFTLLEEYLRFKMLAPATESTYRSVVSVFVKDTGNDCLVEITEQSLLNWRLQVLVRATATTWNNYYRHLRALLRYACARGYLTANPLRYVSPAPTHTKQKKTVNTLTLKTIIRELVLDTSLNRNDGWFWAILLKTLYYTGMRRRQVVNLKWRDIHFNRKEIKLRSETSKTYREWVIPLDERVLDDLLFMRRELKKIINAKYNNHQALDELQVFCLPYFSSSSRFKSDELTSEYLTTRLKRLGKHFGVGLSPHRLRHTFGTEVANALTVNSEVPFGIKALQEQMGHSQLSTTLEYVEPNIKQKRQIVSVLDTL